MIKPKNRKGEIMKKVWKKPAVKKLNIQKATLSGTTGPAEMTSGNNNGKSIVS